MKHFAITLGVLCLYATAVVGQVKTKFQDKDHKHQTVVIKTSEEDDDMEILNSQFNIDEVKVGEEIRITTERVNTASLGAKKSTKLAEQKENKLQSRRLKKFPKQLSSSAVTFKKKKKKRKAVFVYDNSTKKERRKRLNEKCYKF